MPDFPQILELPENDTIVAMATPAGKGALAILRISGPDSIRVISEIWTGRQALADVPGGSARVGIIETPELKEKTVATVWRAPNSYTGQDIVEITVHGSLPLILSIERAIIACGARAAAPGEFTYRALINGKMNLSEAGAVKALIDAPGMAAMRAASRTLAGEFESRARSLIDRLSRVNTDIAADTEFPDAVEGIGMDDVREQIEAVRNATERLLRDMKAGDRLSRFQSVVIVGPPNAGKSTLANALIGKDRSIVHSEPGTTRDIIESECDFGGVQAVLVDTAGLRDTDHGIELIGVDLAHKRLVTADLVINLIDANVPVTEDVAKTLRLTEKMDRIIVLNKTDLKKTAIIDADIEISSLTGEGVAALRELIAKKLIGEERDALWAGEWQIDRVSSAIDCISNACMAVENAAVDAALEELLEAENSLRKAIGENVGKDVISRVFDDFCIGK
ncbi:MAG: tRNA uridine-5-carboxymethylaminomethyl(34) synthesis GTPase MnmE [bacterium]